MNEEEAKKEILKLLEKIRPVSRSEVKLDFNGRYVEVEQGSNQYQFKLPSSNLSSQQSR